MEIYAYETEVDYCALVTLDDGKTTFTLSFSTMPTDDEVISTIEDLMMAQEPSTLITVEAENGQLV